MSFNTLVNWFLRARIRSQIREAKQNIHKASDNLYLLRHSHPIIGEDINKFLDEELYPLTRRLNEIEKKATFLN